MREPKGSGAASASIPASQLQPFLRIPPFPSAKVRHFPEAHAAPPRDTDLAAEVRRLRVGGTYWAAQPNLPHSYVLLRDKRLLESAKEFAGSRPVVLWDAHDASARGADNVMLVNGECDPWHMLAAAAGLFADADDEVSLVAALLDVPVFVVDPASGTAVRSTVDPEAALAERLACRPGRNPFTGEPMTSREALELCGFWRQLVDSNRALAGGLGFAFWKQDHVGPLLWNGSQPFRFVRSAAEAPLGQLAVWRSKASPQALSECERAKTPVVEVEDGFLRSRGLGADCIPPLSITVDRLGAYFDPSNPSELELLLQSGEFDECVLDRARELRGVIVESGLAKYEQGAEVLARPAGERLHILVPGQVEDDRAVQTGGCGLVSNLELLKRVREQSPGAYIIYKPHPDVLAGHRRGAIPERQCLRYADQIADEDAIGSLIAMVDEVHVNTSLAGFEALLRGKQVTTYGVPFYAGWGLTRDLGPVPARRTATRSLDELVAATLLLYPRYLDPNTGLPCPAEVVVARLTSDGQRDPGLLVGVRRLQGKFMRRLRSLVQ
ncbi:MAG: hypothetical protein ACJ8EY_11795 [Sphingomicrobium sp.]